MSIVCDHGRSAISERWGGEIFKVKPEIGAGLVAVHYVTLKGTSAPLLSFFQFIMTQND